MLLSWCKELQGTKLKLNANSGRIIHSVSHNFVENEGTERDILQYICQIKSFAANLTVEIMLGQFLVCGDSSLSRIMPMFSTFGWFRADAARDSRRNRSRACGSFAN